MGSSLGGILILLVFIVLLALEIQFLQFIIQQKSACSIGSVDLLWPTTFNWRQNSPSLWIIYIQTNASESVQINELWYMYTAM